MTRLLQAEGPFVAPPKQPAAQASPFPLYSTSASISQACNQPAIEISRGERMVMLEAVGLKRS